MKNIIFLLISIFIFSSCINSTQRNYIIVNNNINDEIIKSDEIEFNKPEEEIKNNNIAMIYASNVIGKYAIEGTNIAMSYLISENKNTSLKIFDIEFEDKENIFKVLDKLETLNVIYKH